MNRVEILNAGANSVEILNAGANSVEASLINVTTSSYFLTANLVVIEYEAEG